MAHFNLIDFDDSFTYNVAELCAKDGQFDVNVIHYSESAKFFKWLKGEKQKSVLVIGPGPGHPREYLESLRRLFELYRHPFIFHLGICLGHQLWAQYLGAKIVKMSPVHGEAVPFTIPNWDDFLLEEKGKKSVVTRYNSLFANFDHVESSELEGRGIFLAYSEKKSDGQGEVPLNMAMKFPQGISYQFHPESVGTLCPELFFGPAFRFLQL